MTLERRAITNPPELRAEGDGKIAKGYAALFNSRTQIGDYFYEIIAPGAFTETLRNADILALIAHDTGRVIGRSKAGTLRLKEDSKGLFVEIDLPDTSDGRDLAVQLERGDTLVLFSDGVTDAQNVTDDEFGEARLVECLRASAGAPVDTVIAGIMSAIDVFAGSAPQFDDITVLVVRRT